MASTVPIRDSSQVNALLSHYRNNGQYRNYLLITIGVHTALRISDILRLNTNQVYDFNKGTIHKTICIVEKKTGKWKGIALHKKIIHALNLYFEFAQPNNALFPNPLTGRAITRMQANRIVDEAAQAVGIPFKVSCHSLRKTFGYHSWVSGISPALLMEIYNHSSYDVTKRYLGISQDDQNAVYLGLDF